MWPKALHGGDRFYEACFAEGCPRVLVTDLPLSIASACARKCHRCHLTAPACKCVVGRGVRAWVAAVVMDSGCGLDCATWFCSQVV
eukprot:10961978-Alexandrium_andersonii.AAC.1